MLQQMGADGFGFSPSVEGLNAAEVKPQFTQNKALNLSSSSPIIAQKEALNSFYQTAALILVFFSYSLYS